MSGPESHQLSPTAAVALDKANKPVCFQPSDSDLSAESSKQEAAPMKTCDVAIVGGGLAGLALAVGLSSRGYDVQLFEAAPQLRTGTSTMIGLGESVFSLLDTVHPAIVPELKKRASIFNLASMCIKASKEAEPAMSEMPITGRYTIRWSEVQEVIAYLVPPEAVHCGYRATGYTEDTRLGRVRVHFRDQEDVQARLVVASDGIRSPLRDTMLPNDPGPRYLGQMCWNMLLHNPDNSVITAHQPSHNITYMDHLANDKRTISCIASDAGCGYTYIAIGMKSDTPSFTPDPSQPEREAEQAPGEMQPQPYIVGGGKGRPGSKARLERKLEEMGWDAPLSWLQACPESEIFERALLDRLPLDELGGHMSSPGKRVILVGDAAHAMGPGPGQGGCTAFEDAHTLLHLLVKYRPALVGWAPDVPQQSSAADQEPLEQVVAEYEAARLVRVCRVQRFSAEMVAAAAIRDAARPADAPTPGPLMGQRTMEFIKWMNQYPDNPTGDPASTFWKPVAEKSVAAV